MGPNLKFITFALLSHSLFATSKINHPFHSKPNKLNFLVILADDTGIGDISSYKLKCHSNITYPQSLHNKYGTSYTTCPPPHTPNIDRLASEGTRFLNWYSPSPVCSPSRAGLLTGRYPIRTGVYPGVFSPYSTGGLPSKEITIAELLEPLGYARSMAGKWHLGHTGHHLPTFHGFEHWLGLPYSHGFCPCPHNLTHTDEPQLCHPDNPGCPLYHDIEVVEQPAILESLTFRYADDSIASMKKALDSEKPFFQYLSFQHSHHPQFASKQFRGTSARGAYGDSISEMDAAVGKVMSYIRSDPRLVNDTVVFFTSDNGPSLIRYEYGGSAGDRRCGKGTTWEGGQNVPGLVWGGGVESGHVTSALASSLDIFPTIASMAGVDLPQGVEIDGNDLSSVLFDNSERSDIDQDNISSSSFYYYGLSSTGSRLNAVRNGKYKLHFATSGWGNSPTDLCGDVKPKIHDPPLLFDLVDDIAETKPIDPSSLLYVEQKARLEELVKEHDCSTRSDDCAAPSQVVTKDDKAVPWPPVPFHPYVPKYGVDDDMGGKETRVFRGVGKDAELKMMVTHVNADCVVAADGTCSTVTSTSTKS